MPLNKRLLTECGSLLKIGIPITIAQLLNISMSFVDTVMTGNYSAEALAAVSGSNHFIMPFLLFSAAVIGASQAITAQFVGSGRAKEEIGKVTIHCVIIGLFFSTLLILMTKAAPVILPFFGFEETVVLLAKDYIFAFSFGLPAIMIFIGYVGFYAGISKPVVTMLISIVMLLVNVIGNYTLIFGHFGFPEMGAEGAGWTSALSAWSGAIGIIIISLLHREIKQFNLFKFTFRPNHQLFSQILKIGLPSGLSSVFEISMFSTFSLLMGRFGVQVLAGSQIALNCASIIFMIPLGLSFAITTNVGLYIGQQKYQEARLAGLAGYTMNITCNLCSAVVLILFARNIAGIYTDDVELIKIATTLIVFAGIFQLPDGIQVAGVGILRGYKDTKIPMISNLISYWAIGMTLGYFLGFKLNYQAKGMWIGIIVGLSVAAILHALRFKKISSNYIRLAGR